MNLTENSTRCTDEYLSLANRHLNIALSALQMAARQETLTVADKFTVEFLRNVTADSIKHIADIRNKCGINETD